MVSDEKPHIDRRQDSDREDIAETEARARIAKLNLEMGKIELEKQFLIRQLSWKGTALEWAKAATVFAALTGIATTLYLGQKQTNLAQIASQNQSRQAEEARASDRFDKALSRLADVNAGVRMTGIAGLRLFLNDGNEQHQKDALHYLVTAIAEETSREVQQAILDAFVDAKGFSQTAKDDTLRMAIELDRSITESVVRQKRALAEKSQRALIAKFLSKKEEDVPSDAIYDSNLKGLTFLQNMQAQSIRAKSLFYDPNVNGGDEAAEDTIRLDNFVVVINRLISAGARNVTNNWAGIYCQNCNFTAARDLSGANFDRAYLSGANFSHVKLQKATFRDADLGGTVFFSSDLSHADLDGSSQPTMSGASVNASRIRLTQPYPYLECAKLDGATLNFPLGTLIRSYYGAFSLAQLATPRMTRVKFDDRTKLIGFTMHLVSSFDDVYYAALTLDQKKDFEAAFSSSIFQWPEPAGDFGHGVIVPTAAASFSSEGNLATLTVQSVAAISNLTSISDWAKPLFSKVLDQPIWKSMPVTAGIIAESQMAPGAAVPGGANNVPEYSCSDASMPDEGMEIIATQ